MGFIPDSDPTASASNTTNISNFIRSLDDVTITNIQNSQLLSYNSTAQKWKNINASSVGTTVLSGLTDTSIITPLNNQSLIYDFSSSKWENKQIDHTTLSIFFLR